MFTRLAFAFVLLAASNVRAAPANWKATFERDALSTYLGDEASGGVAVVAAGKPGRDTKPALAALTAALKAARGPKGVVKVPKPAALAKLDDSAIVAKLKKSGATRVLVLRVTTERGAPSTASIKVYDMSGALLAGVETTAGAPMAAAEAATESDDGAAAPSETAKDTESEAPSEAPSETAKDTESEASPSPAVATSTREDEAPPATDAGESDAAPGAPTSAPSSSDAPRDVTGLRATLEIGRHSTSQAVSSGTSVSIDEAWALALGAEYRYSPTQSLTLGYFRNGYSMPTSSSMLFHGLDATWRYHLLFGDVDTFGDLGLGWVYLSQTASSTGFDWKATASGLNLSFGLGASYPILDFLSVGFVARYNLPAFFTLCTETNGSETCGTPSSNMKDLAYGITVAVDPFGLF